MDINFTIHSNNNDRINHDSIIWAIYNIQGNTIQEKLNTLSNCNCCARHQNKKPKVFDIWIDAPYNNNKIMNNCACECRNLARFICRKYDRNMAKYKDEKIREDIS